MKVGSRQMVCGAVVTTGVWLLSVALVSGQAGPPTAAQNQMLADNVSTPRY